MGRAYIARRALTAVTSIFSAMLLLFCLSSAIPGDPATVLLGPQASPEYAHQFIAEMGFDKPIYERIFLFFAHVSTGDLGTDVITGRPVTAIVLGALPSTIYLALASIAIAVAVGIPLGIFAATHKGTRADAILATFSIVFVSMPSFILGIVFLVIFSVWLNWLPILGSGEGFLDQIQRLILPAVVLSLGYVGLIARLVRVSMLEVLSESYIRTSRAFGIAPTRIVGTYALRNAMLPTLATLGMIVGRLLGGAVLIEILFARQGLGTTLYDAIVSRNYPVMQGVVFVVVVIFVVVQFVVELGYAFIDPRIGKAMR
ncbi:ABC transporter permease [Mesorhizobium sp.]|uniref:ABC transporter permease n=1 Tax=Mesorhizobium sp. TaxID=1871066 RepID=UPI000FE671BD|nr:ABC transporter permease [Mesorhizobium sp.]RWD98771.1 MAG: ABC transporter permease [Mesorhizobium sp.]